MNSIQFIATTVASVATFHTLGWMIGHWTKTRTSREMPPLQPFSFPYTLEKRKRYTVCLKSSESELGPDLRIFLILEDTEMRRFKTNLTGKTDIDSVAVTQIAQDILTREQEILSRKVSEHSEENNSKSAD